MISDSGSERGLRALRRFVRARPSDAGASRHEHLLEPETRELRGGAHA